MPSFANGLPERAYGRLSSWSRADGRSRRRRGYRPGTRMMVGLRIIAMAPSRGGRTHAARRDPRHRGPGAGIRER
jgi:hypothetical protein